MPIFVAIRAAIYATAFIALWAWLATLVQPFDTILGIGIPPWVVAIGILIAAFGAMLLITCVVAFVQSGRGTPAPFDPPREFVAIGPYLVVRNPMYIGAFSVIFGAALALRSVSIVCLGLAFLLAAHLFVVLYEEPSLQQRFGSSYADYRQRVGRWIPKRGRQARGAI